MAQSWKVFANSIAISHPLYQCNVTPNYVSLEVASMAQECIDAIAQVKIYLQNE